VGDESRFCRQHTQVGVGVGVDEAGSQPSQSPFQLATAELASRAIAMA
jgi:hypothetical protein